MSTSLLSQALLSPGQASPNCLLAGSLLLEHTLQDSARLVLMEQPKGYNAQQKFHQAQAKYEVFNTQLVETAYLVACRAHNGRRKSNGVLVVDHLVDTACILADLGLDEQTVAAGLLHEVLSDTLMTTYQLEEYVPRSVVEIVARVAKINRISRLYREHRDNFDSDEIVNLMVTMSDVAAVLVKLADRLQDMRCVHAFSPSKQARLAEETLEVYSVLANRMGVWCLKAELEDLSFAVLHPEEYIRLKAGVSVRQSSKALEDSLNELKARLDEAGVEYVDMSGRPKNLYGVFKKTQRGTPLSEVYDLMALRIVVKDKADCYRVLREVHQLWRTVPGRFKDYVKKCKKNGYQSLHETVMDVGGLPFEVQIRTCKMHYIAEYGFAAHWKYKENLDDGVPWVEKLVQWRKWVTTKKFGIKDKKLRPFGSPPEDKSLAPLGVENGDFGHPAGLELLDPFLHNERFRLQPEVSLSIPVSVIVDRDDTVQLSEFAAGSTIGQLLRSHDMNGSFSDYMVLLNGAEVSDCTMLLRAGDHVRLVKRWSFSRARECGDTYELEAAFYTSAALQAVF